MSGAVVLRVNAGARGSFGNPANVTAYASGPIVRGGRLIFPPGCAGLVYARVLARGRPLSGSGWVNGDAREYTFAARALIDGPPYLLTLEVVNLDDTFPHMVTAEMEAGVR